MWSAERFIKTIANMDHTNVKIMVVGGGNETEDLKEMSKKYGIDDKFIFAGFVPNHEVSDLLSASDIFWFVMRDPLPTYGLALLEAMSCENIVVTNNSGSMKEVISSGVNGFLVEPEIEQIKRKLGDIIALKEDELNRIKQRARRDVEEKYCWEAIVPKIERIIWETIK
jgi:glycosyltransferase involved in cell wall biosynthesis